MPLDMMTSHDTGMAKRQPTYQARASSMKLSLYLYLIYELIIMAHACVDRLLVNAILCLHCFYVCVQS